MTLHTLPPGTGIDPGARVTRKLVRTDGTEQPLPAQMSIHDIRNLIGADSMDQVRLRHMGEPTHVMLLDDLGGVKDLPVNKTATALYHANCVPGTVHPIRGDVVIVPDDDFAVPEAQDAEGWL